MPRLARHHSRQHIVTMLASGMRLFVSGSTPVLAETHVQFENRTSHRILECHGMTETNMNTSNPYVGTAARARSA